MSRLREPRAAGPVPARALGGDKVLVSGPAGRAVLLTAAEHAAFAAGLAKGNPLRARLAPLGVVSGAADAAALARAEIETGLLNWTGPSTHVLLASARGEAMLPETAKTVVDFVFSTPRPTLALEIVDEDGSGWPAAWLAIEYARRRAEWSGRGLALSLRTRAKPSSEREDYLRGSGVAVRAALAADGEPDAPRFFPAARARVVVGGGAKSPEAWVDALAASGASGVEWIPSSTACREGGAARRFAAFAAGALSRLIDAHETSDLRDESAVGLLLARPREVPGVDLFETLAYAPDGGVFTSEDGWALAAEGRGGTFFLGPASSLRFQELPSKPIVPALATALASEAQPLCSACVYSSFCVIPPAAHFRAQGTFFGRLPDSPRCLAHMALLDVVFSRLKDEKCLKALEKWGVDISRFTC
ncbi:MAG: hypothetical protein ACHQ49_02705 [Elusimicrobiota bacterium]